MASMRPGGWAADPSVGAAVGRTRCGSGRLGRSLMGCLLVVLAGLVPMAPPARGAAPVSDSRAEFTTALDRRVPSLMAQFGVPGAAVALVSSGEVVWSAAYGQARLEPSRSMRPDTLFRTESISKSVTAWGVLRLVEAGRLDLDTPVAGYLPEDALPELAATGVTVRQLLTHTAGMPLGTIGARYAPREPRPDLISDLQAEVRLENAAGESFAYSNVGYNVLELVVEQVSGQDFADYMDSEVLTPLGMDSSSFGWPEARSDQLAAGHRLDGSAVAPYVYPARASGGLHATVGDVARFVAAGTAHHRDSNPVLTAESVDLVHTAAVFDLGIYGAVADGYAFGHFTEQVAGGRTALWHGGQGTGWMSHFHLVPDSGDGIVILTNSQRAWPLIGAVLQDWSTWSGAGSVQMARISDANDAARVALAILVVGCLTGATWLVVAVVRGTRRFAPLAPATRPRRLAQAVAATAVLGALVWAEAQPYLMVSSLFPSLLGWAAVWLTVAALLGLCVAAFPRRQDTGRSSER